MNSGTSDKDISSESVAFNVGWDAGMYGLEFREEWPVDLRPGWAAARKKYPRPRDSDRFIRKWIQLRVGALIRRKLFSESVTPGYLKAIDSAFCPVSFVQLTHGEGADTDWSVDRVDNSRGYEQKNLVVLSTRVNAAKGDKPFSELQELAFGRQTCGSLTPDEWKFLLLMVCQFTRTDEEEFSNPLNYFHGQIPVSDAPLSWIMSLQLLIAGGMGGERGNFALATLQHAAMQSGLLRQFKKFRARCLKYCRKYGPDLAYGLWQSKSTFIQFMELLMNLRPEAILLLKEFSGKFNNVSHKLLEEEHVESWARSSQP